MSGLINLGIYPDAIENIYEICEDVIQDVRDFAEKIGYEDDAKNLSFDFSEDVLYYLEDGFNVHDITNSIIGRCLWATKFALEETQICKDFGISFEGYTNVGDSHLFFSHDGITEEYHGSGDMDYLFYLVLSKELSAIICERLSDIGYSETVLTDEFVENMRQVIENDLARNVYDNHDIDVCYSNHEITGTIQEMVDSFVASKNDTERRVTIERG